MSHLFACFVTLIIQSGAMTKFWNGMCGQNGRIREMDVVCIRSYGLWVWLLSQDHAPGTNMDSRLGSSSEKTAGRDLDSVESGSSLKSARDEGKSMSCLCARYSVL